MPTIFSYSVYKNCNLPIVANLLTGYHDLYRLDFTRHMRVPTILANGTKKENFKMINL